MDDVLAKKEIESIISEETVADNKELLSAWKQ